MSPMRMQSVSFVQPFCWPFLLNKFFLDEKAAFDRVLEQGSRDQIISGVSDKPDQARQVEPAQRCDRRFAGCCPHCFQ